MAEKLALSNYNLLSTTKLLTLAEQAAVYITVNTAGCELCHRFP